MKGVKILVRLTILVQAIKDVLYQILCQLEPLHVYVQMERYFQIQEIVKKVIETAEMLLWFFQKKNTLEYNW